MTTEEIAFIQGAKWWEFQKTGATMWQSDQQRCADQAASLKERGFLGVMPGPREEPLP